MSRLSYRERIQVVRGVIDRLFDDLEATVDAIVADGWPVPMAREGLRLHRHTWNVDDLTAAFEAEMRAVGGVAALEPTDSRAAFESEMGAAGIEATDNSDETDRRAALRVVAPGEAVHIWPTLPGAGLTPVLYGALLGVRQWIRPSSRGIHFGRRVIDCWPTGRLHLGLVEPNDEWTFADLVVVSGADETIDQVRREVAKKSDGRRVLVTGYGHRVSFAVVVDHADLDLDQVARQLARDTVMWHQTGCFSPRAVVFCGSEEHLMALGRALGDAIGAEEERLGADDLEVGELSRRAQRRGVAEFTTTLWGEGLGWVERVEESFGGEQLAAHALSLHRIDSLDELDEVVEVPPSNLQGVALAASEDEWSDWVGALSRLGVTRVCAPGQLQAPPAGWWHDGRPNVLDWLRAVTLSS